MSQTVSERLADFVAGTRYSDLPELVVRAAKISLFDTLAVALGGMRAPGVSEVTSMAMDDGGRAAASLWTSDAQLPPRAAAFTNSFIAAALDFDSLHPDTAIHPDIVVVPTAIAAGEDRGASGKELLAAIALGDDLMCRLGLPTRANSGWFYSSVYGPIASAAITAKLLGASRACIANAIGLGSINACGTQQPAVERSMAKRMQAAVAAAAGLTAGYAAAKGLDGPREPMEGRFGLYRMYERGDPMLVTDKLGTRYENAAISYKMFPSCQCNQAAIEGMLQLQEAYALNGSNVASVDVAVSPYMDRLVGAPFVPDCNPQVTAQFSIRYSIAAVLVHGRFGVPQILDQATLDPGASAVASRVTVSVDAGSSAKYAPIQLTITKTDGEVIVHAVEDYRGSTSMPLSAQHFKEKLASCVAANGRHAGASSVDCCFEYVMNIDHEADVRGFVRRFMKTALG